MLAIKNTAFAKEYIREPELVSLGPSIVQPSLSVSQQLLPDKGPITLGNGTWSWGPHRTASGGQSRGLDINHFQDGGAVDLRVF